MVHAALAGQAAREHGADPSPVRHHEYPAHPRAARRGEHAQDDVDAIGDLQIVGVGDDPADVARRDRVGDQADGGRPGRHADYSLREPCWASSALSTARKVSCASLRAIVPAKAPAAAAIKGFVWNSDTPWVPTSTARITADSAMDEKPRNQVT